MKLFVIALVSVALCGLAFAKPEAEEEEAAEPKPDAQDEEPAKEEEPEQPEELPPLKPVKCNIFTTPVCFLGCMKQKGNPTCCKTKGLMDINCECLRTLFIGQMPKGPQQFFKLMQTQFTCGVQSVIEGFKGLVPGASKRGEAAAEPEAAEEEEPAPKPKAKAKA